jgi:hypothetical protein
VEIFAESANSSPHPLPYCFCDFWNFGKVQGHDLRTFDSREKTGGRSRDPVLVKKSQKQTCRLYCFVVYIKIAL